MFYRHLLNLGRVSLLSSVVLGGCQAQKTDTPATDVMRAIDPTSAVLVFPSVKQRMLAVETGITGLWAGFGRNNNLLGGEPCSGSGPSVAIRQLDDRQRVINGQVRSILTMQTRTRTIRSQ